MSSSPSQEWVTFKRNGRMVLGQVNMALTLTISFLPFAHLKIVWIKPLLWECVSKLRQNFLFEDFGIHSYKHEYSFCFFPVLLSLLEIIHLVLFSSPFNIKSPFPIWILTLIIQLVFIWQSLAKGYVGALCMWEWQREIITFLAWCPEI